MLNYLKLSTISIFRQLQKKICGQQECSSKETQNFRVNRPILILLETKIVAIQIRLYHRPYLFLICRSFLHRTDCLAINSFPKNSLY